MKETGKVIHQFVITGGPCSGKTTGLAKITQELSNRGWKVLVIPETATELLTTGVQPGKSLDPFEFEYYITKKQLEKEELYKEIAHKVTEQKVVIILDRGIVDAKGYVTDEEYHEILKRLDLTENSARDRYDAAFHLVTAADGAQEFYTLENNAARLETPEQAIKMDRGGIASWTGHRHLRIIDNSTDFDEKISRLISEILACLKEPAPIIAERRYLIEKPEIEQIANYVSINVIDIVQTYLSSTDDCERRIRKRGERGSYSYYLAEIHNVSKIKRMETEGMISKKEYERYLSQKDKSTCQIEKKRVCFVYEGQYFEIDIFDEDISKDKALMQIRLTDENSKVKLPDFVKAIEEVTEKSEYRNYNIAKRAKL